MIIFSGDIFASKLLQGVRNEMVNAPLRLVSAVFAEDEPSQLYTRLKHEAAVRVGIEFDRINHSLLDPIPLVQASIHTACGRADATGVMIQKPGKNAWSRVTGKSPARYDDWWRQLTSAIDPTKDVDCLTRTNLNLVYAGEAKILPATVKATLEVIGYSFKVLGQGKDLEAHELGERLLREQDLHPDPEVYELGEPSTTALPLQMQAQRLKTKDQRSDDMANPLSNLQQLRTAIIGRSELVGRPLASVLKQAGAQVDLLGSGDELASKTRQADIVVSATGRKGLITGDMVKEGVIVIDVGSPGADVNFDSVAPKASFITPVPNGVGPVTVACLLENLVQIA